MDRLEFRVLGPIEVDRAGVHQDLGAPRQRAVLAALLVRANQVVAAERLVDDLWGPTPPDGARHRLQVHVANLRKVLEPGTAASAAQVLVTRPGGYSLRVDDQDLDAARFECLATRGRELASDGDPRGGASALREALTLWRGEAFADVADGQFATSEATRLDEARLAATEDWLDAELALGRHAELVGEIDRLARAHQFREKLWAQLIVALYRSGRQAEALEAYQELRRSLRDDLGVEPSRELRELEARVLDQSPDLESPAVDRRQDGETVNVPAVASGTGVLPSGVVTFLLSDVERSTELWDRDGADMSRALRVHDSIITAAVSDAGGNLLKSHGEGDSTLSVFARSTEAVSAALAARRALDAQDWPDGCRLEVRLAVHIGEVEERDGDYYGSAVNRAARIRSLAIGGQILASQAVAEVVRDHLSDDVSLVDLGEQHLRGLAHPERVWAVVDSARPVREAIGGMCPYKGLLAFEPEDAGVFFGREATVGVLLGRLLERKFVVLVGASGSGKSSVVRAGVVADITHGEVPGGEQWSSIICTPGEHPSSALPAEVDKADATHRVVLVVDQMEELFTACDDASERQRFVDALLDAAEQGDGSLLVACALRADFFGHCAALPRLASALSDATVLLGSMTDRELQRAIEAPAEVAGLRLETGLVDVMLRDLAHEPGSLPLLSHALLETWRRRSGRTLTLQGYQESGGVRGAISKTAEAVWSDWLTERRRPVARRIFLRLTELGEGTEDTRRRVARSELVSGVDAQATEEVLGLLIERRLVTADNSTVQVAHEALIREWPRLRGWLDDDREGLRAHRHLTHAAEDWAALGRPASELYRGPRLEATREWLARDETAQLNELEGAFWDASAALERAERGARERRARRRRVLVVAMALLLVVALAGGFVAIRQRDRARAAVVTAQLDRTIAEIPQLESRDRTLALLLAAQVERLRPDAAARNALFSTLTAEPRLRFTLWGAHYGYGWMAPFGDGRRIVALGHDGGDVFDLVAHRRVGSFAVATDARGVSVSPDGKLIAAGSSNGTVTFFDAATLRPVGAPMVVGAPVSNLRFSASGARLAVSLGVPGTAVPITPATTPRLWDVATRSPTDIALDGHDTTVSVLAQSPDGRVIAAGDGRGHVVLHDADIGTVIGDIDVPPDVANLAFSPDGRRLAVGASTGLATGFANVYDVSTPAAPIPLADHLGTGWWVGFESDSTHVVVSNNDFSSRRVFDGSQPGFPPVGPDIETQHGGAPISSVPGVGLVLSGFDNTISVWDPTGGPVNARVLQDVPPGGGQYLPDGTRLVVPSNQDTVNLYRWPDLQLTAELSISGPGDNGFFTANSVSPDGRALVIGDRFGNIARFDAHSGRPLGPPIPVNPSHQPISFITLSPDARLAVTASSGDTEHGVFVVDLATRRSHPLSPTPQSPLVPVFSPDGKQLVAITANGGAFIYPVSHHDVGPGRFATSLGTKPYAVAFSPEGTLLAIGSEDGTLSFHDPTTLRQLGAPIPLASSDIVAAGFSPHGHLLLTEDLNANYHLVDVSGRARIGPPLAASPPDKITYGAFGFAPDDRSMALASPQGTTIWDLDPKHWARDACTLAGRNLTPHEWHQYFSAVGSYQRTCTPPKR